MGPLLAQMPVGIFAVFAERDYPLRTNLCERVTDGARTRALRSHIPYSHVLSSNFSRTRSELPASATEGRQMLYLFHTHLYFRQAKAFRNPE